MQSESNYSEIILLYSIFCIIRIFLVFFLDRWQKPKFHKEKEVLKDISCARVLKTQDLQDPGFPAAEKAALEHSKQAQQAQQCDTV